MFRVFYTTVMLLLTSVSAATAAQSPNCTQIYGGGPACEQTTLAINKQIQKPASKAYVDTLDAATAFTPGQTVMFKLTVSNPTNAPVKNIVLTDIFPESLTFAKGQGKFDAKSRKLTHTIDELKAGETKVFFVEARVGAKEKITTSCVINQALVTANDKTSRDNTRFCLTKDTADPQTKGAATVYPPSQSKTTPGTGPHTLALLSLLSAFGMGIVLLRFSRKSVTS